MGLLRGILWLFGIILITNSDITAAQTKRSSRITSSRSFGINAKQSSSNGVDFNCPEEFGYYPHPSDCTQYYVCVFGGALLESCTGGLMYSHELQTCDWPRNVGCEVSDGNSAFRDVSPPRVPQVKQHQQQQQQQPPQRIRYSSAPSSTPAPKPTIAQQYHRQPSQSIQAQIQTLPPPPELRIAPNPVITSRGQPKQLIDSQEDIAKLYADAHDTLPPVEEEESDRQQRVYRGQPSTVGQVQRDRDGIIHQANVNAIPNHGKVGSYAFGSAINSYSDILIKFDIEDIEDNSIDTHRRKRRDVPIGSNTTLATDDTKEQSKNATETESETETETDLNEELEVHESVRATRQLRPHPRWSNGQSSNYRSVESNPSQQQSYSFGPFNPYLSPPAVSTNHFYKPLAANQQTPNSQPLDYRGYNPSNSPAAHDPFQPYQNFYPTSTVAPFANQPGILPLLIQSLKEIQERRKQAEQDNFQYFHLANEDSTHQQTQTEAPPVNYFPHHENVTPKTHYSAFSTVGGFFNNNGNQPESSSLVGGGQKYPQVVSHYSIPTTTESNYFKYNILQNQRMKNYFATTTAPPSSVSLFSVADTKPLVHLLPTLNGASEFRPKNTTISSFSITSPIPPATGFTTKKPALREKFNFQQFVSEIKDEEMAQMDPAVMNVLTYFKQTANQSAATVRPAFHPSPPDVYTNTKTQTTVRPLRGYESFINSIPNQSRPKIKPPPSTINDDEYYYDEEDAVDDDYDVHLPSEKPAYMPNSETMAPRPQTTTQNYKIQDFPITTRRPLFGQNFYNNDNKPIPSFINFPTDIFNNLHPVRNTPASTTTTLTTTTPKPTRTTTTTTTPRTTTRKIYTVRPNRGNNKWKYNKETNKTNKKPTNDESTRQELNRVETSSQAPPANNIFVQQRPTPKPIVEQTNNRNYYNTSANHHQAYDIPPSYDSYYSVYDDDVDLYRDVEYANQQHQQQHQHQQQQANRQPQASPPRVNVQQQSTYRPEIVTTSAPPRETYINKPIQSQKPQQPQYNQPSLIYNTDYDEALIAQLEEDNEYDQPTRAPVRKDRIEINSLTDRPIVITSSSTPRKTPHANEQPIYQASVEPHTTERFEFKLLSDPTTKPTTTATQTHTPSTATYTKEIETTTTTTSTTTTTTTQTPTTQQPKRSTLSEDGINNKTSPSTTPTPIPHPNNTDTTKNNQTLHVVSQSHSKSQSVSRATPTTQTPPTSSTKSTAEDQRKRILSFIVSEAKPQSFKTTFRPNNIFPTAVVPSKDADGQKSYKFSLQAGLTGFSFRGHPSEEDESENEDEAKEIGESIVKEIVIDTPLKPRGFDTPTTSKDLELEESDRKSIDSVDSNSQAEVDEVPIYMRPVRPLVSEEPDVIEPTTYAPAKSWRFRSSPLPNQESNSLNEEPEDDDSQESSSDLSIRREGFSTTTVTSPTQSSSTTERIQSFTTRALTFKDNLSKTTNAPLKYVSPYKSLETILEEKDEKYKFKTTFKPKYTTSGQIAFSTTQKPFRSYFLITNPPKSNSTVKLTTSTWKYISTTTSKKPTTTTTSTTEPPTTTITIEPVTSTSISSTTETTTPPPRFESNSDFRSRGRSRYTVALSNSLDNDEPTTYSPRYRIPTSSYDSTTTSQDLAVRRKILRRPTASSKVYVTRPTNGRKKGRYEFVKVRSEGLEKTTKSYAPAVLENESVEKPRTERLIYRPETDEVDQKIVEITDKPLQYYSKYRQIVTERDLLGDFVPSERSRFKAASETPEPTTPEPESTTTSSTTTTITTESTTTSTSTATSTTTTTPTSAPIPSSTPQAKNILPPRASRVNNAIKTSIAASRSKAITASSSSISKCADNSPNAKCNEIPSRTNSNNRNRGGAHYSGDRDQPATVTNNRGTHPPRTRPTLKPSGTIVSKAQEFVDIYKNPPTRAEPLYPQPTPDKTAAKCRKDVCLLPDCYCGGKDIPGEIPVENVPQIVLLTFDDSVNDLNKQLYTDLFEKGRVNPNGCPISATFYVSHEWTDYSQVQNLYSDGHEMASHTVSHSFGEQFSQKKWTREVSGQREILSAYGGVKLSDVRGMRAPFLSVGGNKMFKMLYDSNFTYDSSMPVYENRPPSWPYTLDYKIFHDCMIPPCPTRSYPGVWEVPMVMWQDLNGGRCSMGDACSNPGDADNVFKMIMKNFERHYTTNRAPFGLFYHAAWFTQPHHKQGFIKFLDAINSMPDVWIVTNTQALQWVRDPTPLSRINSFQPFQCDYSDRPKRCNNPKVCNLWHKSGVRYMRTCQPCPDIYPWTGKSGIRSSRVDNEIIEES